MTSTNRRVATIGWQTRQSGLAGPGAADGQRSGTLGQMSFLAPLRRSLTALDWVAIALLAAGLVLVATGLLPWPETNRRFIGQFIGQFIGRCLPPGSHSHRPSPSRSGERCAE